MDETQLQQGVEGEIGEHDVLGEADTELAGDGDSDPSVDPMARRSGLPREFGRYVVLDSLGCGGMGVVLRAYDRQLDRPVALKVLGRTLDQRHAQRLRREALAMAKLSHPNVVQVYEVGEVEGQTFVVMELVKGQTVRRWMDQEPRPGWRECVELFIQLGAGLAAAHEQGLVHRDFKPGNAMVDDKGRARVLDFGLVRLSDDEVDDAPSVRGAGAPTGDDTTMRTSLTQTGALLGTPAYMSPEQMRGWSVDARGDQFSFCVALYEAVHGERPKLVESMSERPNSKRANVVRPPPPGRDVPLALRRVLVRGLAFESAERWPSMEALLEQLQRVVAPRRRWGMIVAVGVGLLAVGGGLVATRTLEWLGRCTGARAQLTGVWDDARTREVGKAILGTELAYAPDTWERIRPQLDAYADAWSAEHTDACEATRVRGEQSELEMGLRMACLQRRRLHLRATVDELEYADARVVERAVHAVTSLPGLERCRDLEALRAEIPPPEDPTVAERVAVLDERLVESEAKHDAGRYEDGLRLADEVAEEGRSLNYEPLMARAWLRQGHMRQATGDYEGAVEVLRRAYGVALAHTMTVEAAEASASMVYLLGTSLVRHEEALAWSEHAEPLSRAAGTEHARAHYLDNLGKVADSRGEHEDARELLGRALAIREKALGPRHPTVGGSLYHLGNTAHSQGEHEDARDAYQRALGIFEEALGVRHPKVAYALIGLGIVDASRGEFEAAHQFFERALFILEDSLGPAHPNVANLLLNMGTMADSQGEYERARRYYERAWVTFEKSLSPNHPDLGSLFHNLGNVAGAQDQHEEARGYFERALSIREESLGLGHPKVAYSLTGLGKTWLALDRPADALPLLERALTIGTTHEVEPALLAEARFALARALWGSPGSSDHDRDRARSLVEQARAAYAALGDAGREQEIAARAWLAEHDVAR